MLDPAQFALYVAAAFILAITPGPGIFTLLQGRVRAEALRVL
jgi:threonine/homoserine/homoserine lactone efflux protein